MYEALSYKCMRPEAASVCGLKLLVYAGWATLTRSNSQSRFLAAVATPLNSKEAAGHSAGGAGGGGAGRGVSFLGSECWARLGTRFYLLYWYKNTNTDAKGAPRVSSLLPRDLRGQP